MNRRFFTMKISEQAKAFLERHKSDFEKPALLVYYARSKG